MKLHLRGAAITVALLFASACDLFTALAGGDGLFCVNDQACPTGSICSAGRCAPLATCQSSDECPRGYRCDRALQICMLPADAGPADTGLADAGQADARTDADRDASESDQAAATDRAPGDQVTVDATPVDRNHDAAIADALVGLDTPPIDHHGAPDTSATDTSTRDGGLRDTPAIDHPSDGAVTSDAGAADVHPGYLYWQDFGTPADLQADNGTWAQNSGAYHQTQNCYASADSHITGRTFGDVVVRADFMFDDVCSGGGQQVGVLLRAQSLDGCNNRYYLCIVDLDDALLMVGKFENSCSTLPDYSYDLSGVVGGVWYKMTATAEGDTITCELSGPGIQTPYWVSYPYTGTTWHTGGVGLYTSGAQASFDNLTIEAR